MKFKFLYIIILLLILGFTFLIVSDLFNFKTKLLTATENKVTDNVIVENQKKYLKTKSQKNNYLPKNTTEINKTVKFLFNKKLNEIQKLKAVNKLPLNLSSEARKELYNYLQNGPNDGRVNPAIKNDIMNILRNQDILPLEFTDVLLDLFYDESQKMVVRIYALQHLRPWFNKQGVNDPRIKKAFFDSLKTPDNDLAGVGLLALNFLTENRDDFDDKKVKQAALLMAINKDTLSLNRSSAIQIASKNPSAEIKEPLIVNCRNLAVDNTQSSTVRLSAIAALGNLKDENSIEILTELSEAKAPFSIAATVALKKNK